MNARTAAIAREANEIDASQARAIAARAVTLPKPRNALEAMATRLNISTAGLADTLRSTVFRDANDAEFMALVVVCNEYRLNPMLKEIYAFKAKGGGIVPMVSVDGWIRIMNEHPAFDGIEFDYHADAKGDIEAIEAIIFRKDRAHPIKVIEYMEECKGNSDPWRKVPRRFLRHRALIQGVRVAFGLSGIAAEGDEEFVSGGTLQATSVTLPPRPTLAEELDDEIPEHDKATGEIIQRDARGMSVVDEETARELDANDGTLSEDNPAAAEGKGDEDRGEAHVEEEIPLWQQEIAIAQEGCAKAKTKRQVADVKKRWERNRIAVADEDEGKANAIDKLIWATEREINAAAEGV